MTTEQQTHELTQTTPGDLELRFERILDFPREQVWQAYTDPALVTKWYGGGTRVVEMDVRPGGKWKYVADRPDYAFEFEGEYLEVDPPARVVRTENNGWTHMTTTETVELEDLGQGRTRLSLTSKFGTTQERDAAIQNGADVGVKYQMGQLTQLLAGMSNSVS